LRRHCIKSSKVWNTRRSHLTGLYWSTAWEGREEAPTYRKDKEEGVKVDSATGVISLELAAILATPLISHIIIAYTTVPQSRAMLFLRV